MALATDFVQIMHRHRLSIQSTRSYVVLHSVISVRKLHVTFFFFVNWVGNARIVYCGVVYKQTYVVCNDVNRQSLDVETWEIINYAVYVLRKGIVSLEYTKKRDRN